LSWGLDFHQLKCISNSYLGNLDLAVGSRFLCELVPGGSHALAMAAPRGIELDEVVATGNVRFEVGVCQNKQAFLEQKLA